VNISLFFRQESLAGGPPPTAVK